MSDPLDVLEALLFDQLTAAQLNTPVLQHVVQDTPAPFVMIGELAENTSPSSKDDDDCQITAQIAAVTDGMERGPNLALLSKIKAALEDATLVRSGWTFRVMGVARTATRHPERGEVYLGLVNLTILALADD